MTGECVQSGVLNDSFSFALFLRVGNAAFLSDFTGWTLIEESQVHLMLELA